MDKRYKNLFVETKKIINDCDPIGLLSQSAPENEYEEEVQKIISGLSACQSIHEVHLLVYNIFKKSFGDDSVGNIDLYLDPAEKIFNLREKIDNS